LQLCVFGSFHWRPWSRAHLSALLGIMQSPKLFNVHARAKLGRGVTGAVDAVSFEDEFGGGALPKVDDVGVSPICIRTV
jgi:hypothetical protein